MAAALTAITEHVHFAQTDLVNWTLVTDGKRVMLIDAGFPGQREDVVGSVRQLGFGIDDIAAVLLTHAHIDHFGTAIWLAKTHGTPVFCHTAELGHTKREYLEQAAPADVVRNIWQPRWLKWAATITVKGGMNHDGIPTARSLTAEIAAGLPGAPTAVPTPGHTGGHCSFIVDGVLVSGDALVTGHPLLPQAGPTLLPALFNHDEAGCLSSLKTLAAVEADVMLPGHGPVWRGSIADAAAAAADRHA
ncbi:MULTISPECIES: MBL fold metallo-hydrolase [Mycobacterium]|uniref:MBL fold metallo-hydrolase n=1 Tax=Mycobacterium syngnathidarum TaxID=1908205 RepID=A0A1Q9WGK1_9MYCO|nr:MULTISPECIES: MBL fold metallo-hydrolase [Mycobacterium]MCG7608349.1 MBL fold metallo-hydrolase [Mycobacterium sp. CnD-18-1]OHT91111.1 MBL fold metallo-hydrolase [Mycobacterium syngnathidarum]OLT97933.1 MBL fold metallo-hydrolase [Mycobacterium syngnathidarum]